MSDVILLAYRTQRTEDLRLLASLRDDLPLMHPERPGVIRAIELLRSQPVGVLDDARPTAGDPDRDTGYADGYACEKQGLVAYDENDLMVVPENYRPGLEYDDYAEGFEDGVRDAKTDRELGQL